MKQFSHRPKSGTTSGRKCPRCGGRIYTKPDHRNPTVINGTKWYLDTHVTEQGVHTRCAGCLDESVEPLSDWSSTLEERR